MIFQFSGSSDSPSSSTPVFSLLWVKPNLEFLMNQKSPFRVCSRVGIQIWVFYMPGECPTYWAKGYGLGKNSTTATSGYFVNGLKLCIKFTNTFRLTKLQFLIE